MKSLAVLVSLVCLLRIFESTEAQGGSNPNLPPGLVVVNGVITSVNNPNPNRPDVQAPSATYRPLATPAPVYPDYPDIYYQPQPPIDIRSFLVLYALINAFTPNPTSITPGTTESTTTGAPTPAPEPTPATAQPTTVTVPAAFSSWYEYKGCRYLAFTIPQQFAPAATRCSGFGSGATLAQRNVQTLADRGALFVDGLGLTASSLWLGLRDQDGDADASPARWLNNNTYIIETGVTVTYTRGTSPSVALASGHRYESIIFVADTGTSASQFVCEYCPP